MTEQHTNEALVISSAQQLAIELGRRFCCRIDTMTHYLKIANINAETYFIAGGANGGHRFDPVNNANDTELIFAVSGVELIMKCDDGYEAAGSLGKRFVSYRHSNPKIAICIAALRADGVYCKWECES